MKVEIRRFEATGTPSVSVSCNDATQSIEVLDAWIRQLRLARNWLKREQEKKA